MADITLTAVERDGDKLKLTGSGFTKTTTTVFDGEDEIAFEFVSDVELLIDGAAEGPISAAKGEVTTEEIDVPDANPAPPEPAPEAEATETIERVDEDLGIGPRDPYPTQES